MFAEIKSNGLLVCGAVVAALGMASTNTPIYGSETASATIALASNQIVGGQTQYTLRFFFFANLRKNTPSGPGCLSRCWAASMSIHRA